MIRVPVQGPPVHGGQHGSQASRPSLTNCQQATLPSAPSHSPTRVRPQTPLPRNRSPASPSGPRSSTGALRARPRAKVPPSLNVQQAALRPRGERSTLGGRQKSPGALVFSPPDSRSPAPTKPLEGPNQPNTTGTPPVGTSPRPGLSKSPSGMSSRATVPLSTPVVPLPGTPGVRHRGGCTALSPPPRQLKPAQEEKLRGRSLPRSGSKSPAPNFKPRILSPCGASMKSPASSPVTTPATRPRDMRRYSEINLHDKEDNSHQQRLGGCHDSCTVCATPLTNKSHGVSRAFASSARSRETAPAGPSSPTGSKSVTISPLLAGGQRACEVRISDRESNDVQPPHSPGSQNPPLSGGREVAVGTKSSLSLSPLTSPQTNMRDDGRDIEARGSAAIPPTQKWRELRRVEGQAYPGSFHGKSAPLPPFLAAGKRVREGVTVTSQTGLQDRVETKPPPRWPARSPEQGRSSPSKSPKIRPRSVSKPRISAELRYLLSVLRNPKVLEQSCRDWFKRNIRDGNHSLTIEDLERLLETLHAKLGLSPASSSVDTFEFARLRLQRFDLDGDGLLNQEEFLELYRWTLWLRYEQLESPMFKRVDLIGAHKGTPNQFYTIGKKLGEGSFGIVNEVVSRVTSQSRVMKTINKKKAVASGTPLAMLKQEIDLLVLLDHPHIVRLFEHYSDLQNIYIITDVCNGGELLDLVKDHARAGQPFQESWVARVFSQVLEAIVYCHAKGVMHKDLKFENIMLRDEITSETQLDTVHAVIIDVGLSELFGAQHHKGNRSRRLAGNLATMAPEVMQRNFSCKCDVWSIGCMLFAIFNPAPNWVDDGNGGHYLYGYPFAPDPTDSDPRGIKGLLAAQRSGPPLHMISGASPEVQDAVRAMLEFSEVHRPTAVKCLEMDWFKMSGQMKPLQLSNKQVRALLDERAKSVWRRAATINAATELPASKLMQLAKTFETIDVSRTGCITRSELATVLQSHGVSPDTAKRAAKAADLSGSGQIEWSEFVAAVLPGSHELFSVALQVAFQKFDVNRDGCLDRAEVTNLIKSGEVTSMHLPVTRTVDMMIEELSTQHNGKISFSEFHNYFITADVDSDDESLDKQCCCESSDL